MNPRVLDWYKPKQVKVVYQGLGLPPKVIEKKGQPVKVQTSKT